MTLSTTTFKAAGHSRCHQYLSSHLWGIEDANDVSVGTCSDLVMRTHRPQELVGALECSFILKTDPLLVPWDLSVTFYSPFTLH
jgi:hypothetical protein